MGYLRTVPRHTTVTIASPDDPFITEHGERIESVELAVESWGKPDERAENIILVFHALTGDAHAASHPDLPDDRPGWWEGIVGPGKAIDTDRYFVVCANALGSCYGSTGPRSLAPDGRRYDLRFPKLTVRDLVAAQARLLDRLGIERVLAVVGGSLGGMQAIEFASMAPERAGLAFVIAASNAYHAQGIAFNEIQRRAIMLDPAWNEGDYEPDANPGRGVALARMVGMVTFQSDALMDERFGREPARYTAWPEFQDRFDVEGYLHYQGDKLADRFDANTYLYLSRVMDSHDIGRGRGGEERAAAGIGARCVFVGIDSDILFPASHVRRSASAVKLAGADAVYREIRSINGHDAFLNRILDTGRILTEELDRYRTPGAIRRLATASDSARTATAITSAPLNGVSTSKDFRSARATRASAAR